MPSHKGYRPQRQRTMPSPSSSVIRQPQRGHAGRSPSETLGTLSFFLWVGMTSYYRVFKYRGQISSFAVNIYPLDRGLVSLHRGPNGAVPASENASKCSREWIACALTHTETQVVVAGLKKWLSLWPCAQTPLRLLQPGSIE